MNTLYKKAKSAIFTNGFVSKMFSLSRSVRQGVPLSAYLYIIQAEPLAETVRKYNDIRGI